MKAPMMIAVTAPPGIPRVRREIMEQLGKAFLISGYLPAAIFLLVHQLVLFPRWTGGSLNLFGAGAPSAGEGAGSLEGLSAVLSDALNWLLLPLLLPPRLLPLLSPA